MNDGASFLNEGARTFGAARALDPDEEAYQASTASYRTRHEKPT